MLGAATPFIDVGAWRAGAIINCLSVETYAKLSVKLRVDFFYVLKHMKICRHNILLPIKNVV
jgi:hypothetical protein